MLRKCDGEPGAEVIVLNVFPSQALGRLRTAPVDLPHQSNVAGMNVQPEKNLVIGFGFRGFRRD